MSFSLVVLIRIQNPCLRDDKVTLGRFRRRTKQQLADSPVRPHNPPQLNPGVHQTAPGKP